MNTSKIKVSPASPWKRIFAWVYDWLPAAGVFVLVFVIGRIIAGVILAHYEADQISEIIRNHPLWWAYLTLATSSYYIYCWQKSGQTVALKTWRLKLVNANGEPLGITDCFIRAFLSFGGIANIWAFVDADNRGWHDIAVNAYLVQLPKMEKTAEEKKPLI